jgi:uncharacterized protein YndB with AHSA1/START domain
MTAQTGNATTVRASVDVAASPERSFEVFTAGFDGWWNRDHHLLPGTLKACGIEPYVGGRVWEENDAGETCTWGRVLGWDPPRSFAYSCQIGTDWGVPAADAPGSTVTVTFTPTETGMHVELVHDHLDVHGDGWEEMRDSISSDGGWNTLLRRYAAAAGGCEGSRTAGCT